MRLYTADDGDWAVWEWQARALFPLLLRVCDRVGVFKAGKHGARALAARVRLPVEVVDVGLACLLADGCVTEPAPGVLWVRNYLTAQEAKQSDRQRKADQRERDRAKLEAAAIGIAAHNYVTNRDAPSQDVTKSHNPSHGVTDGHAESQDVTPCLAVPCRAVDPPISPASGGQPTAPLLTSPQPKPTRAERAKALAAEHRDTAVRVLDVFNAERERLRLGDPMRTTDAHLTEILLRLRDGATFDECRHVIRAAAHEVQQGGEAQWFNPATLFRKKDWPMRLAKPAPPERRTYTPEEIAEAERKATEAVLAQFRRQLGEDQEIPS